MEITGVNKMGKWLYRLLGFKEDKIIESDDTANITINAGDNYGEPIYMNGDTIWFKEGKRELK